MLCIYDKSEMAGSIEAQGLTLDELLSYYGLEREQEKCSREIRNKIAIKIINWKNIGRCLGISEEKLVAIECDNRSEEERRIATLNTWHEQQGYRATYLQLITTLYDQDYRNLAGTLCEMIKEQLLN